MHPAESAGDRTGRAAASEDRALRKTVGAALLVNASMSAAAWLADTPRFNDRTGERRKTYIQHYLNAYHRELRKPV